MKLPREVFSLGKDKKSVLLVNGTPFLCHLCLICFLCHFPLYNPLLLLFLPKKVIPH